MIFSTYTIIDIVKKVNKHLTFYVNKCYYNVIFNGVEFYTSMKIEIMVKTTCLTISCE